MEFNRVTGAKKRMGINLWLEPRIEISAILFDGKKRENISENFFIKQIPIELGWRI